MGNITFRYSRFRNDANVEGNENLDENGANEVRNQNDDNEEGNQNDDNEEGNQNDDNSKDKVLRLLRMYLAFTGQHCPFKQPATKNLYKFCKFSLLCLAVLFFVYTLGIWGSSMKECDIAYYFYTYPISWSESVLWEFRWMVTGLLGILLTNGIWIELFNNHISLENSRWKKVKYVSWALLGALIFLWVLTLLANLSEIDFKVTRFNALPVFADALFSLLDRVIVFPLFFLFCITMYILCCMVEEYRDKMEEYRDGENSARDKFREVKAAVRIAGLSFEGYLMVHFLFLVCTFFLGVCACFEQMEVRIAENYTVSMPIYIPHSARFINFYGYGNLTFETHGHAHATQAASLLTGSYSLLAQTQSKDATTGANNTLKNQFDDLVQTKWFKKEMRDIVFCTIIRTLESLLLYLVPIMLMVRLENRLRRVYEVIEDSNIEDQNAKGYLFNEVEVIRRMCKYVKTAHGLRIFGYTVPAFETFIIAAFGPFIGVVIQRLLVYTHMKK